MREVVLSPKAERDLDDLFFWIAEQAGPNVAVAYTGRLRSFVVSLDLFPGRARVRDDIAPGVRAIGFEGRTNVHYVMTPERVVIVGFDHGGRPYRPA
jgi:toxin ParE1/3/4